MTAAGAPGRALLLVGASALLAVVPTPASAGPQGGARAEQREAQALALLEQASRAARERVWSGAQYVATWQDGATRSSLVQVHHDPVGGTVVHDPSGGDVTVPSASADAALLSRLASRYVLAVTGRSTCTGRTAQVVQARRADGRVAARFWVDDATGLVLRREVYDVAGRLLRSSELVSLQVGPALAGAVDRAVSTAGRVATAAAPVPDRAAVDLAGVGWEVPRELPGGFGLFDAGRADSGPLLHLAYSDGLSTVSVFAQPGAARGGAAGATRLEVDGGSVWVTDGTPERVVWNGGGQAFTLVSDAGPDGVLPLVRALPHDPDPDDGWRARLRRGLARVGSWLDPTG